MKNDYKQVYKNTGTVPRTLHEAYRDGEYGYSVHLFKDDTKQALQFLADMVVGIALVGVLVFIGYAVVGFLG